MRTLLNILWHIPFLGFITALGTWIIGLLFVITIVGVPIGHGMFQLSKFLMAPFSREMISIKELGYDRGTGMKVWGLIAGIIYLPFGILVSAVMLVQAIGLAITIIGFPLAIVIVKQLSTVLYPINKQCVSSTRAQAVRLKREMDML